MATLPLIKDFREQPWLLLIVLAGLAAFGYQIVCSIRQGFVFEGAYYFDRSKNPIFFWAFLSILAMITGACAVVTILFLASFVW